MQQTIKEVKETQTQIGTITFVSQPDMIELQPVAVAVAVARVIGRPVQCAEVVPLPRPERLCWAQFAPVARADPYLPVPLVEFAPPLWEQLLRWGRHFMQFSPHGNITAWADKALGIASNLAAFLASNYAGVGLDRDEAYWLTGALWQSYAQPQGAPELLASDTRVNRERRRSALQAARLRAQLEIEWKAARCQR